MTQAIILAVSRVALFAGDVFMDGTGLVVGDGWSYRPNADEQLVAVEVAGLPAGPWVGGAWRVTEGGEWVVHDQALLDAAWTASVPSLDTARAEKLARLADHRYRRETGGTTVGGAAVRTDRESQALLTGAAVAALLDSGYAVAWKTLSGWVTLNAASIIGLASAVRAHVQACFDRERALAQQVEAATSLEELAAVDMSGGWPPGDD